MEMCRRQVILLKGWILPVSTGVLCWKNISLPVKLDQELFPGEKDHYGFYAGCSGGRRWLFQLPGIAVCTGQGYPYFHS